MSDRARLAIYWAAGCGGCEISVLNLHEQLLDVIALADVVFCPALVDTKRADVEAMPDAGEPGSIDVCLLNGAMRTSENIEMAHLLRRKSRVLIAYGSCSNSGCVPGLANLTGVEDILRTVYTTRPSGDNPGGTVPRQHIPVTEGALELPLLAERVVPLHEVVPVDYAIPGCPPEPAATAPVLTGLLHALTTGGELPPPGSVLGAGPSTVCVECSRRREGKIITAFRRNHLVDPDPELCLLEQGLVCMGIATREGCGALCPAVNMPCIGCYGPPAGVRDQGAAMVGALGAAIDVAPAVGTGDDGPAAYADSVLDGIPDWTGSLYKFSLAASRVETVANRHRARGEHHAPE